MFLNQINWRHIVGALVTGLVLNIAGIINFWLFLGLIAVAITVALAQNLPVGKRPVTAILIIGTIVAIGIPTIHAYLSRQWPATYESLQEQSTASDLKGAEHFNQPGLKGVAGQRKLANDKEKQLIANAQTWFDAAASLIKEGKFNEAAKNEKRGREILDLAIAEREADGKYIKEKISSVKIPAGWWESVKNFFSSLNLSALAVILQKGFSLRLLVLGFIILILGLLLLKRFPESKMVGVVTAIGGLAILYSLFLLFTPEITPAPGAGGIKTAAAAAGEQAAKNVPAGNVSRTIALSPGQWSETVYDPPGHPYKSFFRGPKGTRVKFADGTIKSVGGGTNYNHPMPMRFINSHGGEVEVIFRPL